MQPKKNEICDVEKIKIKGENCILILVETNYLRFCFVSASIRYRSPFTILKFNIQEEEKNVPIIIIFKIGAQCERVKVKFNVFPIGVGFVGVFV